MNFSSHQNTKKTDLHYPFLEVLRIPIAQISKPASLRALLLTLGLVLKVLKFLKTRIKRKRYFRYVLFFYVI
jgi:hypothetical protein